MADIDYDLDQLYEEEVEFSLGSGLCGRIAGEYLDSLATLKIPSWAYGLRYEYGLFQQEEGNGGEILELPQFWLEKGNPWELERSEIKYQVHMGGTSHEDEFTKDSNWDYSDTIQAVAYDIPITGFNTFNTNNLRLWRSRPYFEDEEECNDLVDRIDKM